MDELRIGVGQRTGLKETLGSLGGGGGEKERKLGSPSHHCRS